MPHPFAGILLSVAIWLCICVIGAAQEPDIDAYAKWSTIELKFNGPESQAQGTPNPFAIPFDVIFTAPSGNTFRVPGFYDGDGRGAPDGKVWKVRFAADELGTWSWRSQSTAPQLDGASGRFGVTAAAANAPGFWKWGRLAYTGTPANAIRYLKFRDGPYWLKAGCDDPENFLGAFRNFNTPAKRRAAVDYLSQRGINSLYIMTHNLDGDHNDVWPWLGQTPEQAKSHGGANARFDIAKLQQWRQLFKYMQTKGVVPYLILEDDSAWKHYDHARYYREILARFGDLPAVVFNLGEEHDENYSLAESLALAQRFKALDPYNHPLGIHNVRRAHDAYVDSPYLDLTSIQTGKPGETHGLKHAVDHNQIAIDWIKRSRSRGQRVPVINFDEGRPELDRRAWWSAYIGGGVWEAHVVEPYDQPLSAWEPTWTQLGGTRAFMESLPFHAMQPRNDLIKAGTGLCLAREGQAYAVYLPQGGAIEIDLSRGALYEAAWWNPNNGFDGKLQPKQLVTGGRQAFKAPSPGDWALRIVRTPNGPGPQDATYFPLPDTQGGWRQLTDARDVHRLTDMNVGQLDEAFRYIQGSSKNGGLLVLKDGWLVYEKYFGLGHRDATPNLASCGKSFTSIAVGILMAQRPELFPDGLDQKIFTPTYFPPQAFPLTDPAKAEIRLGQLLAFTAGIRGNNPSFVHGQPVTIDPAGPDGWPALVDDIAFGKRNSRNQDAEVTTSTLWCQPGGGFSYATASIHLASIMLRHLAGTEMETYIDTHLAQPLGWGTWGFAYRHKKQVRHTPGGGGIALRATDMLRFGYLLLHEGRWQHRQLVPADYVRHSSRRSRFNPHFPYSLQFTVNTNGAAANLPRDAYWKQGSGGHALYIVPSHQLVVWKLGGRDEQYKPKNTGLSPSPAAPEQIRQREGWRRTVDPQTALRQTLKLVLDAASN